MLTKEYQDFLTHYGVPGMKWGKRKAAQLKSRPTWGNQVSEKSLGKNAGRVSKAVNRYMNKTSLYYNLGNRRFENITNRQRFKNTAMAVAKPAIVLNKFISGMRSAQWRTATVNTVLGTK